MAIPNIDTDNTEFQNLWSIISYTPNSVFLTGKAGTGKSTFLKYICSKIKKKYVVLAPTGIAAINVHGSTLHSFFKLPFAPILPDDPRVTCSATEFSKFIKYNRNKRKLLKELELIIIDEISMVRADTIDLIDRILRLYSGNKNEPFGGKQMLFVGDVFQLEPVITADIRPIIMRHYSGGFFFNADVFKNLRYVTIELQKVYRQSDINFMALLDRVRSNNADNEDVAIVNSRYGNVLPEHTDNNMCITLTTTRNTADIINEDRLNGINEEEYTLEGVIEGEFPENSLPTPQYLYLKRNAQIIFIKNDVPDRRWVNGTIGIVHDIVIDADEESENHLEILLENGEIVYVLPEKWDNIAYTYDEHKKTVEETVLGSFRQYPIRLAWAITIHKSQGLTFNRVNIDLERGSFSGGQTYVALSRCTSLEGITLNTPIKRSDIFVNSEIVNFAKTFNNADKIRQAIGLFNPGNELNEKLFL